MIKIVVIFHRLGPYHYARLNELARVSDLSVIELYRQDITYDWNIINAAPDFKLRTMFEKRSDNESPQLVFHKILESIVDISPDIVAVPGWADPEAISGILSATKLSIPIVVMSETQAIDDIRSGFKEFFKRKVVRYMSAAIVGGTNHADYAARLGVAPDSVYQGYDAVDNNYFMTESDKVRSSSSSLRIQNGLPEKYFLSSSRFIDKKNLPGLIQAFAKYRTMSGDRAWSLVLMGSGELQKSILQLRDELSLGDSLILPGFKQYEELPLYYGLAEVFIHASTIEPWGLVVNEAMASCLPVLVSNRCGCAPDLVQQGRNGFIFDPYNVDELADLMVKCSSGECDLKKMGDESRAIISDWGPERFADGMMKAAEAALAAPLPRPSLIDRMILRGLLYR